MCKNIGKRLRIVAIILFWFNIVLSIVGFGFLTYSSFVSERYFIAPLYALLTIFGSLASYLFILILLLYRFCHITKTMDDLVQILDYEDEDQYEEVTMDESTTVHTEPITKPRIPINVGECYICGMKNIPIHHCLVCDEHGNHEIDLCLSCMNKHNGKPC